MYNIELGSDCMPELPEVESVVRALKNRILNYRIMDVEIYLDNIIDYPNKEEFTTNIKNQEIVDVTRRGKWIVIELTHYYLLVHLRMEGKFFLKETAIKREKHEHIIFHLNNGKELRYRDTRKFGKMLLLPKEELENAKPFRKIGVEPFGEELTVDYLKSKFKSKIIPIKTSLLDQTIIAGIGNIYVDEILFLSHVYPGKKTSSLSKKQITSIVQYTKEVLTKAVEEGGTKIRTYTSMDGEPGHYQNYLNVHTKSGSPCPNCGTLIEKIKIGGRGTYYCKKCQKR